MKSSQAKIESGSTPSGSLRSTYFDSLYERSVDGDPWRFAQSPYEAAKYAATLARLPRSRYISALEVGCSIGVFTKRLADRVDHLLAVDVARSALARAEKRCQNRDHVRFSLCNLLDDVPDGPFDLIVLAEVAYYWTPADFARVHQGLVGQLAPGGQLILVHWRSPVPDYPRTGDAVHQEAGSLAKDAGLVHLGRWVEAKYRTDLWQRPPHDLKGGPVSRGPEVSNARRQSHH